MSLKGKKTLVIGLCCLFVLLGTCSIYAYLIAEDRIINEFSVGDVEISLEEPNWDAGEARTLVPKETVLKDPTVTNTSVSDVFVGVSVSNVKYFVDDGFVIGLMDEDNYGLQNSDDEVFCWDPAFSLVDRDGAYISAGEDHALTGSELSDLCAEQSSSDIKLYFAYNDVLKMGDKTPSLFSGIQNKSTPDGEPAITVVKYFTKEDGTQLYIPVSENDFTDGRPSVDVHGEYIYKYKVKAHGVLAEGIFNTYEAAAAEVERLTLEEKEYSMLNVQAAAIQSRNDSIGSQWVEPNQWYPMLPTPF